MVPVIVVGALSFLGYRFWVASKEKKAGAPVIAPAKRPGFKVPTAPSTLPKVVTHYTSVQYDRITEIAKRFGQPIGSAPAVAQWAAKNGPQWATLVAPGKTVLLPVPTSTDLGPIDGAKGTAY